MKRRQRHHKNMSHQGHGRMQARSLRLPASDGVPPASSSLRAPCCRCLSSLGQQIIEYAVLIAAVAAAFSAMFLYGKRGLQATIRESVVKTIGGQVQSAPLADVTAEARTITSGESFTGGGSVTNTIGDMAIYSYDDTSSSTGAATAVVSQESTRSRAYTSPTGSSGSSGTGSWWDTWGTWPF